MKDTPKVQFLRDTGTAVIPKEYHNEDTLIVYRDGFGYNLPDVPGAKTLEWLEYKTQYADLTPGCVIFVGLNRIRNPQNRTDMVFAYMSTLSRSIPKYSIDTAPFLGEPWRVFWHYTLTYGPWMGVTYSYIVETHWQHWFYRDKDTCPLWDAVTSGDIPPTLSDLPELTTTWEFTTPKLDELAFYDVVKEEAFSTFKTPKTAINSMLKNLSNQLPKVGYDDYRTNKHITLPDLPIYRFVVEENHRRMTIYNRMIGH